MADVIPLNTQRILLCEVKLPGNETVYPVYSGGKRRILDRCYAEPPEGQEPLKQCHYCSYALDNADLEVGSSYHQYPCQDVIDQARVILGIASF